MALIVRLIAIDHGFPYIYHPDEPAVVRSALGIRFDSNPHHFDWPHLYFYLNYFVYMVFAKMRDLITSLGFHLSVAQVAPIIYNDNLIFYLISRIFSATLGALTIIPIYLWIKRLVNKNAGLFASVFLSLAPLHVRQSHYALVDVPMLFFLSWSLFFSTVSPILSGLFLGFSASTKYNGILGGLFIALYYLLHQSKPLVKRVGDVVKLTIFTIIGFLIGTPYALFDYKTFIRTDGPQGALWQFTNVGKVSLVNQIGQFLSAMSTKLPHDLGYGAWAILLTGLVILGVKLVKQKQKRVYIIILLTTAIFLALTFYVSGLEKNRSHYYIIIYPYFFLVLGWALSLIVDKFKRTYYKVILTSIILLPSLILSISNIVDLENKRSSTIYGGYIEKNVKMF
ncbi:MAG: glycosyltransferase family 39 protein [Patescibacteria group bacterium]